MGDRWECLQQFRSARARCSAAILTLALCLVPSALAQAAIPSDLAKGDVAVSPDGAHVYVATDSAVLALQRDPATGDLASIDRYPMYRGERIEISPDGRSVYVGMGLWGPGSGPQSPITAFRRDPATGRLSPSVVGMRTSHEVTGDMEIASDGRHVYVSGSDRLEGGTFQRGVIVYSRDLDTGDLSPQGLVKGSGQPTTVFGQRGPLALTSDGRHLYEGSDIYEVSADGSLTLGTPHECEDCADAHLFALNPSQDRLYVADDWTMFTLNRDTETGALGTPTRDWTGYYHDSRDLTVGSDGSAYVVADSGTVQHYRPRADGVDLVRRYEDDAEISGLTQAHSVALSPGGENLYVAAPYRLREDHPVSGSVAVFRRRVAGGELTFSSLFKDPYDARKLEVSINGGAPFTNDRDVIVTVDSDPMFSYVRFSNHATFTPGVIFEYHQGRRYPWRLESTGPEGLPKTVYVGGWSRAGADDIMLDQRAPQILSARLAGRPRVRGRGRASSARRRLRARLLLRARDNRSRVTRVQVTSRRAKPGPKRRYRRRIVVVGRSSRLWVRVFDGAGNHSRWRTVRARRR